VTTLKGSGGGGGKGGGGSARTPVEDPDSLFSKQYARVIDMVSEGEIKGLVNGLKSVYLNDTPVENADGTQNFSGLSFDWRTGTQSQTYIEGFPSVEAETGVSVEIKQATPVVRTVTGANLDAVRVTISVPALTKQNVKNGDLGGSEVQLLVEVQTDGGGYVDAAIRYTNTTLSVASGVTSSLTTAITAATLNLSWLGDGSATFQTITYRIDYRAIGAGSWTALNTGSFEGTGQAVSNTNWYWGGSSYSSAASADSRTVQFDAPVSDTYEFRVVTLTGTGTLSLTGTGKIPQGTDTIKGKTTSRYQRSYNIPLSGGTSYDIRVTRVTADSETTSLRDKTYWDSYTEITEGKFTYPNSALMAVSIDAEGFSSIPSRSYEIEGLIINIPSNYDPLTRVYDGVWDGTFTTGYSNNPAWCFYEMIVNDRFGLGDLIPAALIDKWSLYTIAQYCDEMVSDGLAGLEPRFTMNMYIQSREEAYKVLEALASVFNALAYWANGSVTAVQDSVKSPVALFTPANIVDGMFNYSGSSIKTRHTVALVSWNDPKDNYRQAVEYVTDDAAITRYGIVQTEVAAVGCTSRGQAHRFGRAILFAERLETETISFKCGLDAVAMTVGDIINTTDPIRAGTRRGGRLISATTTDFVLDADITIDAGIVYTLWAVMPDGTVESQTILTGASTTDTITTDAFSATAAAYSMYVVSSTNLVHESWRVLSVVESDKTTVEVTALEYSSDKYAAIEDNLKLEPVPTSQIKKVPDQPTDLVIEESLYLLSSAVASARLTVSFKASGSRYEIHWKKDNGNWAIIQSQSTSVDIEPVTAGIYSIKVTAVNAIGVKSPFLEVTQEVYGLTAPPADVTGFELAAIAGSAFLTWDATTDLDVIVGGKMKIRHTTDIATPTWSNATDIGGVIAGTNISATLPLVEGTYLAKWVDSSGNQSVNETAIITNAPSVIGMNFIESLTESSFTGTHTGTGYDGTGLILDSLETIGEQLDVISTWPNFSFLGGSVSPTGEYLFASAIDLGSVQTSRITASQVVAAYDVTDLISDRPLVSTWLSIVGDLIDDVTSTFYVRTSDDNITFGAWETLIVGDYTARAFEFKLVLTSSFAVHNIQVQSLLVSIDMPDRTSSGEDIVSGAGTKSVTFPFNYQIIPALGITAQNMETGDYYEISNKAVSGFDIIFKNSGGTAISRTFDHISRGY